MTALVACFEEHGYGDVVTYIQSGNVVFTARGSGAALTREVEAMLAATFDHYEASVVIRSRTQMRAIVDRAPEGFGDQPGSVPLRRDLPDAAADLARGDRRRPPSGRAWTPWPPVRASSITRA